MTLRPYINLLRPYQWIKNLLLFAPLFFSGNLFTRPFSSVLAATICFCLLSSTGYILNDWLDRKSDAFHPEKKHRPICSGKINGLEAIILASFLIGATLTIIIQLSFPSLFLLLLGLYFALTVSYSFSMKNIAILELFTVSMGFVLRVMAGGAACGITVTSWLFLTVFFISMMISVAKRVSEFEVLGSEQRNFHRVSLKGYSLTFLTNILWACGGVTLVVYALYVVEHGGILVYSVLPATYGVFRFLFLADKGEAGDPIGVLFVDIQLLLSTIFFLMFLGTTIYINRIII